LGTSGNSSGGHHHIHINETTVEKLETYKFLGVHITDKLKWSTQTDIAVKKAQECLFNFRRLKKFGLSPKTLTNFYRCTIESILLGCIAAWYGNCPTCNRRALQRVVHQAINLKARSGQVNQGWHRETEKQLLSKRPSES
jgi:hypothetical protein